METNPPTPTLTEWLSCLITGLQKSWGEQVRRINMPDALAWLVWNRLVYFRNRILAYVARYRAGTLGPAPARRVRAVRAERYGPPAPKPTVTLPRQFGWMLRMVPGTVSTVGASQWLRALDGLLEHPEMVAMLALAPQLARVLRPMCHMMGIKPLPAALRLPPRKRAARKKVAPAPFDAHPEMWRWPHISMTARFGTRKRRKLDAELEALEEERKKREEGR